MNPWGQPNGFLSMQFPSIFCLLFLLLTPVVFIAKLSKLRSTLSPKLHRLLLRSLRQNIQTPLPQHIALIMDGNRRYARKYSLRSTVLGHQKGSEKLLEVLNWCLELGIQIVTVYAFSIENFKREKGEVEGLMGLAKERFDQMLEKSHLIQEHKVRVRVLGDLNLLSADLRCAICKVMQATRDFTDGPTLNICFAYTSRHEMARAMGNLVKLCDKHHLRSSDIDEEMFAHCLYTGYGSGCDWLEKEPEILIRTSGERRLSDFLLWQCSESFLAFRKVMWPEFSVFDLIDVMLDYQDHRRQHGLKRARVIDRSYNVVEERKKKALDVLKQDFKNYVDSFVS